jgi:citrate/tricarballylate utilization protein
MERRHQFGEADLEYLANLCHNCAECYYACQYAPPHEFAVNVPKALAQIRVQSYERYAWPPLFRRGGRMAAAALLVGLAGWGLAAGNGANFYAVISHGLMVGVFGTLSIGVGAALVIGFIRSAQRAPRSRFRIVSKPRSKGAARTALFPALCDILTLKYLSSGGSGCTYPNEEHSSARRWFHHCTFYGFLLCLGSTSVAAFDHYVLGLRAPYPYVSLPVMLGAWGGIGLLIGPAGLYALKRRRDEALADRRQDGMDLTFLGLLFATSLTGLGLLGWRGSMALRPLLVVHLAFVLTLLATLPYGKFVHGIYRAGALLWYAMEERGGGEPHSSGQG